MSADELKEVQVKGVPAQVTTKIPSANGKKSSRVKTTVTTKIYSPSSTETSVKELGSDDIQWLRQYKMHQEQLLYSRINIFILSLSLIAAIFVTSASGSSSLGSAFLIFSLPILGILLTFSWWYAVRRQKGMVDFYRHRQANLDPFYQQLIEDRGNKGFSGQWILVNGLPLLFLLFWLIALSWSTGLLQWIRDQLF